MPAPVRGRNTPRIERKEGPCSAEAPRTGRSERLGQACLFEHRVGGEARLDLVVNREASPGMWRVPDVVIALARTLETTAGSAQQPDQIRCEAGAHGLNGERVK